MFVELFESLRKVTEVVATANPQRILKDYYADKPETLTLSTYPSAREGNWYKFWLLSDGTIIPVEHAHHDTAFDADVGGDKPLLEAGAVRGYIDSVTKELGVDALKWLTKRQIHQLINLYIKYKATSIAADIPGKHWRSDIKSSDHLDYLLTYGKDVDEAKLEDEKEQFFLDRTNAHIKLVQGAASAIVEAYPEFAELLKHVETHDDSKLKEPERTPYIEITWRHKLEKEKGGFDPYNDKGYQTPGKLE